MFLIMGWGCAGGVWLGGHGAGILKEAGYGLSREAGRPALLTHDPPLPGTGCSLCSSDSQKLLWLGWGDMGLAALGIEETGALPESLNYTSSCFEIIPSKQLPKESGT